MVPTRTLRRLALGGWLCLAPWLAWAQEPPGQDKTGTIRSVFTEKSPLSNTFDIAARISGGSDAYQRAQGEKDYDLAKESFGLYIPHGYDGKQAYGLMVFIWSGADVAMPAGWDQVLEKHKLILAAPYNAGNDRPPIIRIALALDAVHNVKKQYHIDANRIYAAGLSGGGRVASMATVIMPEAFSGGLYIIGCNYYRELQIPGRQASYRRGYTAPAPRILAQAKKLRHVMLEGENDENRDQTKLYVNAFKQEGFAQVTYLQVPGMGHTTPSAEWFEKAIIALDAPAVPATQPDKPTPANRKPTTQVATPPPRQVEAEKVLRLARLYVDNRLYDQARSRLQIVITQYADTPAALEARGLFDTIKGK